jgi:hypothetical protein
LKSLEKDEINLDANDEVEEEISHHIDMRAIVEKLQAKKPKNPTEEANYKYSLQNSNQMANYLEAKIELLNTYKRLVTCQQAYP